MSTDTSRNVMFIHVCVMQLEGFSLLKLKLSHSKVHKGGGKAYILTLRDGEEACYTQKWRSWLFIQMCYSLWRGRVCAAWSRSVSGASPAASGHLSSLVEQYTQSGWSFWKTTEHRTVQQALCRLRKAQWLRNAGLRVSFVHVKDNGSSPWLDKSRHVTTAGMWSSALGLRRLKISASSQAQN